ncbi:hypothetical protein KPL71_026642 [Citrus sinensis]|uniref:Uncharacterized protein n=1 Tax=Citrus sinensis TaxID=2711 RepID=A0ACB8I2J5_CITSI|nr:hypothetical protein KPL71_026642 [Citrus sinensis]
MAEASSSSSSTRTTVTNAKFEVEKFDGTNNFGMWQCEVLDVLCQQELDVALEEKPDMMDDKEWIKINRQTCGTIRLCLAKDQKYSVMREISAKKLWETLEEKYMKKSLENRLFMKKKLYRFTYTPSMSMNDHVNSFNKILADLLNLDEQFEDEDKALLLFNSLPDEYDHLTTTLLHGKDSVTFDAICSALYNSETRKKDRKDHRDTVVEFSSFKELDGGVVFMGNDNACKTMRICTIQLKNHDDSIQVLTDVRYVSSLKKNLISLGVLESKGLTITLRDGLLKVVVGALTVMKGTRRNNLYYFQGNTIIGSASTVYRKDVDSEATKLWHMRLGHAGEKTLQTLTRVKFGSAIHDIKEFWTMFTVMCGDLTKQLLWEVKRFRSDNGGEYKNDPFIQICQDEGIVRHFIVRDTPQQNGVAECMNWTILEKVRCMLSNAGLGKEFWAEAVVYACHLINRLPSTAIEGRTPMEMWTGKPATDYDSLHVFGSTAYYHVKESKLDPRAKKALFMAGVDEMDNDYPSTNDDEEVLTQEPSQQQDSIAYRRPRREIHRPARFVDMVAYALPIVDDDVPSTYREAKEGIDYNVVFSPVVKHSFIRILLAMVAQFDLELVQLDVKIAFLHGDLEEEIYITQPDGFKVAGKENWVCKLTKSLYGLKQSPRQWYKRFDRFMKGQRYIRNKFDHCVYFRKLQEGSFIYLLLYVDDMLIASKSKDEIEKLKTQLDQEFEMKDLGEAKKILNMEICRDRARGKMQNENTCYKFRIQKTVDVGLLFKRDDTLGQGVIGYVDSDYAGDLDKRRSTIGYVFTFAGGPIS